MRRALDPGYGRRLAVRALETKLRNAPPENAPVAKNLAPMAVELPERYAGDTCDQHLLRLERRVLSILGHLTQT